ncbi:MAG: hypothetical protein DRP71_01105 [Verrucomicrobia bacterium]|nr:MAG: hypothetical protein DRP71_01105 [Verrucomicrobiota bacterium]
MPGPTLLIDGYVLLREPTGEKWVRITLLSPESGVVAFLQRISHRSLSSSPVDLFDRVTATLERRTPSGSWFAREVRVIARHPGLGRRYPVLREACIFARILSANPVHEDSRASVYTLLGHALRAWERGDREDVVAFKCLYVFARDEGYAVREGWWPQLPEQERVRAVSLVNLPIQDQEIDPEQVVSIRRSLEHYLVHFTDIRLESRPEND